MKVGLIGLGFMGSTHLKALKQISGVELAAVASDDPAALTGDLSGVVGNIGGPGEKYDFSAVRKYADFEDAVRDPDVEAVDLCLPTHLHARAAVSALRAGKHVLVEKPMALNAGEAEQMMAAAAESGKILMTAQVLRFWPAYVALADTLRSGRLGPVRSALFRRRCAAPAWSRWMADRALSGGGVFDLLIHDVDMCLHLFGRPESVSASGHEDLGKGIDVLLGQLRYPDIGTVTVTGGWHHPKSYPFSMEYTVVADGGTIDYSSAGRGPTLYTGEGAAEELPLKETDGYREEIAYFLDCCRTGRKPELCPPEESALAVQVTNLLVTARRQPGRVLPVEA